MIEIKNLNFSYSNEKLYNNLNFRILNNEHVVLVGPNGTGKSTLLKLIAKELIPDSGSVIYEKELKVGYLDQYMKIDNKMLVKTYLYDVYEKLFDQENLMNKMYHDISNPNISENEMERLLNIASNIQEQLIESNFYQIKSMISNIIHGFGLSMDVLEQEIKTLSSGMKSKIILAKLLLEENDLILLDEPTNFLDISHVIFLSKFLNNYEKAFIVVSHNVEFVREIANVIISIEGKTAERYKGNYDFYLVEKEVRANLLDKKYEAQQKLIKTTKDFIDKNITRASTTKRAQSRRKMLNKIERIEKRIIDRTYNFSFPIKLQTGKDVLKVVDLEIGYNNNSLLEPLNLIIRNKDKVVITGKNGIGKSTLIKTIIESIPKISGDFYWDKNVKINYLGQDEFYLVNDTPFNYVSNYYESFTNKEIYALLARYGITFEMANRPINTLSGGEQMKIKLALMKDNYGNVLILDEPTNHLDINAKEALKEALNNYEGTLILVSHEASFYEEICDYEISLA